ncbi:hypothetical protein PAXRUDRAFT_205121 [Paxillus rubicundulus Ve08.2h10]|uniref:Uncharacterized protein n=1 Tax=Paxillus rubicundulus Ve08.2h10 TaxID=930991 RepID=A0A0D0E1G0_9AGAM|nr:hypothetical protein PAXRUDRAFT_205121 [Paxillus rubicundulus Ve08.2h10]
MYAAKFTVFYVIATFAALASASPVPVTAPEVSVDLFLRSAEPDVLAREPLAIADAVVAREPAPEGDVEARICRFGCL